MKMYKFTSFNLNFHELIQINSIDSWLPEIMDNYWCILSYGTSSGTSYGTPYGNPYGTSYGTSVRNEILPPVMDSLQS
jgi:hypothetical protein